MTAKAAERRAKFQLVLVVSAALYFCSVGHGAYWWLVLIASGMLTIAIFSASAKAERPGEVTTPDIHRYPGIHRVLASFQERREFDQLLRLAERVGRTLPALEGLVEPSEAGELLAQALWDGAKSLARKEEIRGVRDDLKRHAQDRSGSLSRSRLDLLHQQKRADVLWKEVHGELEKLRSHLAAAAEAGEAFMRDRQLNDTLSRTEKTLERLSAEDPSGSSVASEQLADETTAVVEAYRELHELYGSKR
jgi:hypothetical protein